MSKKLTRTNHEHISLLLSIFGSPMGSRKGRKGRKGREPIGFYNFCLVSLGQSSLHRSNSFGFTCQRTLGRPPVPRSLPLQPTGALQAHQQRLGAVGVAAAPERLPPYLFARDFADIAVGDPAQDAAQLQLLLVQSDLAQRRPRMRPEIVAAPDAPPP